MTNKAMVVALSAAIGLGVIALWLLKGGGTLGPSAGTVVVGQRITDIAPSGVVAVTIASKGTSQRIVRMSAENAVKAPAWAPDAEWLLMDGASGTGWPIPPAQMQGLLRTIAEATAVAAPERGASVDQGATVVTLSMRVGPARVLRLSSRTIAGTGLAEVSESDGHGKATLALISDELHRACTNPGPIAWRDRAILAGLAPEASRLRLASGTQRISLAKLDGQWTLREPVAAPADSTAVIALLGALSKVQVVEFSESLASGVKTGIETPSSRLTLEVDRRSLGEDASAAVKVETTTLELVIGASANAQGSRVFASMDGKNALVLDAAGLSTLTMDPGAYLWPGALKFAPADVTSVRVDMGEKVRELVRSDTRWSERGESGLSVLTPQDSGQVEALLSFLAGTTPPERGPKAERPKIAIVEPSGLRTAGKISVTASGAKQPEVEVHTSGEGVTLKTGAVYRTFAAARVPAMLRGQPIAAGAGGSEK